jgi:cobalt-zinc-cadmium efflux system membrane fusion protein
MSDKHLLLICLSALGLLTSCGDAPAPAASTPQPILQGDQLRFPSGHPQLGLLKTENAIVAGKVPASLPARLVWDESRTQRIYPAFSGRVAQLHADVGQQVQVGSMLAEMASPEFGSEQTLFETGITARKELEQAQAEAQRAQAEAHRASSRTQLYGGKAEVSQRLHLTASLKGWIVERNLNPHQEVRPEMTASGSPPLFVITDPESLWLLIDAREGDLLALQKGQAVEMTVATLPGERFTATVSAVADFIDPVTRTLKIRASVPNPKRLLKAEMLANVSIARDMGTGVRIPASAVFLQGTQHSVFIQPQIGVYERRDVRLLHEGPQEVFVGEGLAAGEAVVTQNALLLAREFRIAREAAQRSSPATSAGKATP